MRKLRKRNLTTKARSKRSEKRAQKTLGGRLQPASGALPVAAFKGDLKTEKFLVDDKTTAAQSYSVNLKFWRKLKGEAFLNHKRPMIRVEFEDETLYVVDELTLMELLKGT